MAGEAARWSVCRSRISDYSSRKERRTFRRAPSGHGTALAGESAPVVSSRLRNFLCGQVSEGKPARPQPELLGPIGGIQVLGARNMSRNYHFIFVVYRMSVGGSYVGR